jgi:hypothetical protein
MEYPLPTEKGQDDPTLSVPNQPTVSAADFASPTGIHNAKHLNTQGASLRFIRESDREAMQPHRDIVSHHQFKRQKDAADGAAIHKLKVGGLQ